MPARAEPGATHVTLPHRPLLQRPFAAAGRRTARRLAFMADTQGQDTAIFVLDVETGERAASSAAATTFLAGQPAGRRTAARSPSRAARSTTRPSASTTSPAARSAGLWQCEFDVSPPRVVARRARPRLPRRRGSRDLGLVARPRAHELRCLDVGRGNHYAPGFTPDGAALMVVFSGPGAAVRPVPRRARRRQRDAAHRVAARATRGGHRSYSGRHVCFTSLDHLAEVPGLLVRAREAERGRRRHRPRRPHLAPLQRVGPAAPGVPRTPA